jgi:hypothetical protein
VGGTLGAPAVVAVGSWVSGVKIRAEFDAMRDAQEAAELARLQANEMRAQLERELIERGKMIKDPRPPEDKRPKPGIIMRIRDCRNIYRSYKRFQKC